jgi:predicted metalloprotease with PDZ domain
MTIEMRIPAASGPLDLVMPAWIPGSYLIREFARNVQDFVAHDGSGLRLRCAKIDKATWRVEGHGPGPVVVRYRVYANELSVRTSHLDASHGFVNGASVFMFARGMEDEPVRLAIEAPSGWRVSTSLHETESGEFLAENYDELVDCPLELGTHRTIAWSQEGVPHRYAVWGPGRIDEKRLIADTRRIIEVCSGMFEGIPYERYLFILHVVPEGRGGLEHKNSCALQVPPSWLDGDYEHLLALVAHEFFHVWLGKRIRPEPLGPFDYTAENHTRHLWVVEGFTTYYTDLILLRAGLISPARYLERLGDSIARLRSLPGRHRQSLEESSFDAWIRFYRPDANTPNAQISYYHKGSLVALALDLEIRRESRGERSLDDVMRILWERYGAVDTGFPEEGGIQEAVEEVYGDRVDRLFDAYVSGTEEIDFDRHLEAVGLELVAYEGGGGPASMESGDFAALGAEAAEQANGIPVNAGSTGAVGEALPPEALAMDAELRGAPARPPSRLRPSPPSAAEWRLGLRLREDAGRMVVAFVLADTPAHAAGINAGDQILAVEGVRASSAWLDQTVRYAEAGSPLEIVVSRRDELRTIRVVLGEETPRLARIVPSGGAAPWQLAVRAGWLRAMNEGAGPSGG